MFGQIITVGLNRADLAQNNRINRLQMRRIGRERHMHFNSVEFAIGAGAQMIFDIA